VWDSMQVHSADARYKSRGNFKDYLEVIKPRETSLLVFIGVVTSLLAGGGVFTTGQQLVILSTLLLSSAGANGLTNYLDREIDSRLERTHNRALPSGRIYPAEKALYFTLALTAGGFVLAWGLNPYVFLADAVGTITAIIYRKRVTCVFPQGMVASCAPLFMGWLAVTTAMSWELLLLCILIGLWLPSHIWSIMLAHRSDYLKAGISYFPVDRPVTYVSKLLFIFSILLYGSALSLYFVGDFGILFLVVVNGAGIPMIYGCFGLMKGNLSWDAWKLYKYSAFPYLGALFLAMALDLYLR
jgi:heme o synthase